MLPLLVMVVVLLHLKAFCQAACICQFKSQCIGQFDSLAEAAGNTCDLPNGAEGFCCDIVFSPPPSLVQRTSGETKKQLQPHIFYMIRKTTKNWKQKLSETIWENVRLRAFISIGESPQIFRSS